MKDLRVVQFKPAALPRRKAAVIDARIWDSFKDEVAWLHRLGLTQKRILLVLEKKHAFKPTQLWAKMNEWNMHRSKDEIISGATLEERVLDLGSPTPVGQGVVFTLSDDLPVGLQKPLRLHGYKVTFFQCANILTTWLISSCQHTSLQPWCCTCSSNQGSIALRQKYSHIVKSCYGGRHKSFHRNDNTEDIYWNRVKPPACIAYGIFRLGYTKKYEFMQPGDVHHSHSSFAVNRRQKWCKVHYGEVLGLLQEWLAYSAVLDGNSLVWMFLIVGELARSSALLALENVWDDDHDFIDSNYHLNAAETLLSRMSSELPDQSLVGLFITAHRYLLQQVQTWHNPKKDSP